MFKGLLIALGIMLVSPIIPIAHFVLVPASPFLGGYFGIAHAKPEEGSYAMKGLIFGGLLGLIILVVLVVAVLVAGWFWEISPRQMVLVRLGIAVFTLYTASMATLGAMYSALKSRNRATERAPLPGEDA